MVTKKSHKKVKAYVWTSVGGGLVQIGRTMYNCETGKQWHTSEKPWLRKDKRYPPPYKVSSYSIDGAKEAMRKFHPVHMHPVFYNVKENDKRKALCNLQYIHT